MKATESIKTEIYDNSSGPCRENAGLEMLRCAMHDMKAPLHSILGFTEIIKRKITGFKKLPGKIEDDQINSIIRDLDIVTKESLCLADMISNILDYSGFCNNDIILDKQYFRVEDMIKEISEYIEPLVTANGLEYEAEIQDSMPMLLADRARMLQVLRNIATNSVKFTTSGKITCSVKYADDTFYFSVADTGCGIPEEWKKNVFNKFYKFDNRNNRSISGNGLGLTMCKSIVELHGGTIWFENAVPKGTIFYFKIPSR